MGEHSGDLRIIHVWKRSTVFCDEYKHELEILRRINHPNVVNLVSLVSLDEGNSILLEDAGESLSNIIDRHGSEIFTPGKYCSTSSANL